jgi:hypothetical protein
MLAIAMLATSGAFGQDTPKPESDEQRQAPVPQEELATYKKGDKARRDKLPRYGLPILGPSRPAAWDAPPLNSREKFRYYLRAYQPEDILRSAFWAAIAQWQDEPPEWEQGMKGYGHRFGTRYAAHAIRRSIQYGVGELRHEDPRYLLSGKQGFWPRFGYVASRVVLVRSDHGGDTISAGRLLGAFGAGFIANAWKPPSSNSTGDALVRGGVTLGGDFLMNFWKEFWPDIKNKLRRKPAEMGRTDTKPGPSQ